MQCHYASKVMGNNTKAFTEYSKWTNERQGAKCMRWLCQMWSLLYWLPDYRPVLHCKVHALYCQMWGQASWMVKIKVYAACFLLWKVFKSWITFSTYCESDFFNGARLLMGLETRRFKNATNCDRHRTNAMEIAKIYVVAIYPLAVNIVLWSMWWLQGRELL